MEHEFFLPKKILPKNFEYPNTYMEFVSKKLPDLEPWHFYYNSSGELIFHFHGLKERYPDRVVVPFARRGDNDDVACFEAANPSNDPEVTIIHDWASPGWEQREKYKNFLEWLEIVKRNW